MISNQHDESIILLTNWCCGKCNDNRDLRTAVVFIAGVCTIVVSVADFTLRDAVTTSLALELIVAAR